MNTPVIAARRFFNAPWLIGIALGCLALVALGLAMPGVLREQPMTDQAQRPEVTMVFQIYRANEWRTEKPMPAWNSDLARYRAGERTVVLAEPLLAGWARYRAGERALLIALPEPLPAGWARYRAGERALR